MRCILSNRTRENAIFICKSYIAAFLLLSLLDLSCSKKAPISPDIIVNTIPCIFTCTVYEGRDLSTDVVCYSIANFNAVPIPDSSRTELLIRWNGKQYSYSKYYSHGGIVFHFNVPNDPNIDLDTSIHFNHSDDLTVELHSSYGYSIGQIKIPDSIVCTSPANGTTIPVGTTLKYHWRNSINASYYQLYLRIQQYDSLYNVQSKSISRADIDTTDSLITDEYNIKGMMFCIVEAFISPYNGPILGSPSFSNMTGDIKGYLSAEGTSTHLVSFIGYPVKSN